MKKLIVFLILSGWVLTGFSQETKQAATQATTQAAAQAAAQEPAGKAPYNVIKFLPFNLAFNSVAFEYEGMVSDHNSMTLQVGIPNHKAFDTNYNIKFLSNVTNAELGTTIVRLAYRHYSGNQKLLPAGFYFEPYLKYQNLKGNGYYITHDAPYQTTVGVTDVKLNTFNLGFQMGAQFLIGNRLSVDVYFLGLEAGLASGDMSVVSENAAKIAADINDAISDLPSYVKNTLTVTQSQNKVNVNAKNTPYPWFRAGISIGIAF